MDYEKALEKARAAYGTGAYDDATLEFIFPQIKESEEERARKAALEGIEYLERKLGWDAIGDTDILDVKEYLEKQKEQKPEHFELKAGKWYICHRAFCCRADHLTVKEGERFQCEKDGIVKGFVIKEPEKYFKECSAPAPMEDEQQEQKPIYEDEYQKMLADSYKCGKEEVINFPEKYGLQKPAEWSEEDEKMIKSILFVLESYVSQSESASSPSLITTYPTYYKELDWLENRFKSIRPQQKVEWSEEDEDMIDDIIRALTKMAESEDNILPEILPSVARKYAERLKSLRPSWKPSDGPVWRIWRNGACGNSEGNPIALVKESCGYKLVSCLGADGEKYIMLSDLEKLPGFNEK